MSSFKIIKYAILLLFSMVIIDGLASKKESYKGLIIEKKYANNTGLSGGHPEGGTPFAPIPEQAHDPRGYSFSIRNKLNKKVHVVPDREMYNEAKINDSILYFEYKGFFTNILWNTTPHKILRQVVNINDLNINPVKEEELKDPSSIITLKIHSIIKNIYKLSDVNVSKAIIYGDSLIQKNKASIDSKKTIEIQSVLGEILYDNNEVDLALKRFLLIKKRNPLHLKNNANIAGCYIKIQDYNKARELLIKASKINKDYKWLLGNYYEVIKSKPNAIKAYKDLYDSNNQYYLHCKNRIDELKNSNAKFYTELKYLDRRKFNLLIINNSGGFEFRNGSY